MTTLLYCLTVFFVDAVMLDQGAMRVSGSLDILVFSPCVALTLECGVLLLHGSLAGGLQQEIADEVTSVAQQLQQQHAADVPGLTAPAAIVPCSALTGQCWHKGCTRPGCGMLYHAMHCQAGCANSLL